MRLIVSLCIFATALTASSAWADGVRAQRVDANGWWILLDDGREFSVNAEQIRALVRAFGKAGAAQRLKERAEGVVGADFLRAAQIRIFWAPDGTLSDVEIGRD